jgi:NADPH:quinone reductase-like Zn-dependent oxidoreductase
VQIAKVLGAEVTGVCSNGNVETARSLGAAHVVDYTKDDFTRTLGRHDLLLDIAGSRSFGACRRVLEPEGRLVIVGAQKGNRVLGPLGHVMRLKLASLGRSPQVAFFIAKLNKEDLLFLRELLASGEVTPVIDREYALGEVADAFSYLGEGHARGKIVVTI